MQIALIISGLLMLALIVARFVMMAKLKKMPLVIDNEKILILSDANFNHQMKNKVVLVDFWASWCAPCKMMAPVLNDVAKDLNHNSHVGKVDIEQEQALANRFKIRSIPTFVLLKNGVEVKRFSGIKSKDYLLKEIKNVQ